MLQPVGAGASTARLIVLFSNIRVAERLSPLSPTNARVADKNQKRPKGKALGRAENDHLFFKRLFPTSL